jgi:hypothetical protein
MNLIIEMDEKSKINFKLNVKKFMVFYEFLLLLSFEKREGLFHAI